jgi:hypothetical protein
MVAFCFITATSSFLQEKRLNNRYVPISVDVHFPNYWPGLSRAVSSRKVRDFGACRKRLSALPLLHSRRRNPEILWQFRARRITV